MNSWPSNFLDRLFRRGALGVLDKGKSAGAAGFPVERADDLRGRADL